MLQQERLGDNKRSILIILDDVVLSSKDQDQLACLAIRGRHFGISLLMLRKLHNVAETGPEGCDGFQSPDEGRSQNINLGVL